MITKLGHIMIPVDDCAAAVQWYTQVLGFEQHTAETKEESGHHWAMVRPKAQQGPNLILFACRSDFVFEQKPELRHHECLHHVMFETDDCQEEVARLSAAGAQIVDAPSASDWGMQATFRDPFGNEFTLIERLDEINRRLCMVTTAGMPIARHALHTYASRSNEFAAAHGSKPVE